MITKELLHYFHYDELAASVWKNKYAKENEKTPDDMHKRLAKAFEKIENESSENTSVTFTRFYNSYINGFPDLSSYGRSREKLTYTKIYNLFKDFKYIIPQGSVMAELDNNLITSLSNCFVIPQPYDSYGGICNSDEHLVQLMKRRGGVGIDISTLRPSLTPTTNSSKLSTGAISFMHRFSNTTREVAQNGRRGALMISIDINHPDVLDFINIKRDLTQVTGANISIKLNNQFMESVKNNDDYYLRFPCNIDINTDDFNIKYNTLTTINYHDTVVYIKKIKAKEYWDNIIKSAHSVAEPGLMFWDNMLNDSPDSIYDDYTPITTNPCSEIAMQPYDACRLIAVNLYSFVQYPFTGNSYFDFDKFYKVNYEAMRLSDHLVTLELKNIKNIIKKIEDDPEPIEIKQTELNLWNKILTTAKNSRRTGLGFTALGDTLAALNIQYDSNKALKIINKIMKWKMESELDCTIDMAIINKPFEGCLTKNNEENQWYEFVKAKFPLQYKKMKKYGRRNVSFSTVAPTGTVSIMTQTTSGIEPIFSINPYIRRKKVNPTDSNVRVDFIDQNKDSWEEYAVIHSKFLVYLETIAHTDDEAKEIISLYNNKNSKEDENKLIKLINDFIANNNTPYKNSTANDINWVKRIEIQSVIQKYITHSISSTINLPATVSEEEVSKIYFESWKKKLKGITVYRDGSRSGVLITKKDNFSQYDSPKRPKQLDAKYHFVNSFNNNYAIIIGLLEDKPYEIFIVTNPNHKIDIKGKIIKLKKGIYNFVSKSSNNFTIENLQLASNHDEKLLTRWISMALRHGINPKFIVEQIDKSILEFSYLPKIMSRILKKYIPNGEKSTIICTECKGINVIFEEGCNKCLDCGASKCS